MLPSKEMKLRADKEVSMSQQVDHDQHGRFPTDPSGLPEAERPQLRELAGGDTLDLRVGPVAKRLGDTTVRMLGYNGSIPGPTLKVQQGSEIVVNVTNDGDLETTVHWHGLRLENKYDGVPHETQAPIPIGGSFSYRIQFPDPGLYWYHPHIREDYSQELGLYGNIVVVPAERDYWPPVDRDLVLTLDDLLLEDGKVAPFSRTETSHAAMGRFGDVFLVSGDPDLHLITGVGEVLRLWLTNTASTRVFNVRLPGARMNWPAATAAASSTRSSSTKSYWPLPSGQWSMSSWSNRASLRCSTSLRIGPIGSLAFMCRMSQRDGRVLPSSPSCELPRSSKRSGTSWTAG
jgi:FtsP/CotA-like multicopper oxidase with cupredoxin domain